MSKHEDYTKYSKEPAVETKVVEPEVETVVEETPTPVVEPKAAVVTDCIKLNVRKDPSTASEVVCEITAATELMVYENESTEEFYRICTSAGIEGYCMKKFVTIL